MALVLFAHWPLVFNDGIYWDDWIVIELARDRNWTKILDIFNEQRNPIFGYIHLLINLLKYNVLAYRLASLGCLMASTCFVHSIARRFDLDRFESFIIAGVFALFPAYQVYPEAIMLPYALCLTSFLGAAVLTLEWSHHGRVRPALMLTCAILFTFSFQIPSLIAFYAGFLMLWAGLVLHTRSRGLGFCATVLIEGICLLAIPLPMVAKTMLLKPYGVYANYNAIALDGARVLDVISDFARISILQQMRVAVAVCIQWPIATLAAITVALAIVRSVVRGDGPRTSGYKRSLALGMAAILLFILACIPYALVGKAPSLTGSDTRNALLVAAPVALACCALLRLMPTKLSVAVASCVLAAFTVDFWVVYVDWQDRWISDRALIAHIRLKDAPSLDKFDKVYIDGGRAWDRYNFYEFGGILKEATGSERLVALPTWNTTNLERMFEVYPRERYLSGGFTDTGCSMRMQVRFSHPTASGVRLAVEYTKLRLLRPDTMDDLLLPLIDTSFDDVSARRVSDLASIRAAVESYFARTGSYPRAPGGRTVLDAPSDQQNAWIPGLVPVFAAGLPRDPVLTGERSKQYLYISDGNDYKLVAHNAEDLRCVIRARPELEDPRRPTYAYGFWSHGAAQW